MEVKEARGKFCCRMQVNDTRDSLLMCEANECMAWQWYIEEKELKRSDGYISFLKVPSKTEGYCGLVGVEVVAPKPSIKQDL